MKTALSQERLAALTGFSRRTIYNYLHQRPNLGRKALAKIEAVIRRNEYAPDFYKKIGYGQANPNLAVVFPANSGTFQYNPYHDFLLNRLHQGFRKEGYQLIPVRKEKDENPIPHYIKEGRYAAYLNLLSMTEEEARLLVSKKIPAVSMSGNFSRIPLAKVVHDEPGNMERLVGELVERGFSRLAVVTNNHLQEIWPGYRDFRWTHLSKCLAGTPLEVRPEWVLAGGDDLERCGDEMARLLSGKHRPQVIFTYNDYTALAVLSALGRKNLEVPRDVSVVGMDGIAMGAHYSPALTTLDTRSDLVADLVVSRTLAMLKTGRLLPTRDVVKGSLLVRDSLGRPRGRSRRPSPR